MADNSSMLYSLLLQPVPKRPASPRDPAKVLGEYFQFPEKNGDVKKKDDSENIICRPEFYRPNRKKKRPKNLKSASRKSHMRRIRAMRGKTRLKLKRDKRKEAENKSDNIKAVATGDSEAELDDSEQDPDYCEDDLEDEDEDDKPLKKLKEEKEKPKKVAVPLLKTDKLTRKEQIQLSKTLIAQKFIQNAFQFFTKNRELRYQDFTPSQLTTACLGLHRNTVQKYRTGPLRPPKPPKQRPKPITNVDEDTMQTIKVTLDELVGMKGQATLDSLFKFLKEKERFKGGRSSLFSILKKTGLFKKLHGKTPGNRAGKTGNKKNVITEGTPKPPKGPPKKRAKQAVQLQQQLQQQLPQTIHPQPPLQIQHQPQLQHHLQQHPHQQAPQLQPQQHIPQQPQQQVQQQPQPQPQAAHQQPQYQMPQITYTDFQNLQALCQTQPYIPNSQTFGQNQTQASCQNPLQYPQSFYRL